MSDARKAEQLFILNYALLATHEVDSAYWHEWALFGLPGGIQLFVIVNLALLLFFLVGLVRFVRHEKSGTWFSLGLSAVGVIAFVLHGAFLVGGRPEFRAPVSLALLGLILVASLAQGWYTTKMLRRA